MAGASRFQGSHMIIFLGKCTFQRAGVLRVEINDGMSVQIVETKQRWN